MKLVFKSDHVNEISITVRGIGANGMKLSDVQKLKEYCTSDGNKYKIKMKEMDNNKIERGMANRQIFVGVVGATIDIHVGLWSDIIQNDDKEMFDYWCNDCDQC